MTEYRYPGSRPFQDADLDRRLFFGREGATQELLHTVLVKNLIIVYAKSGMGKTSLLNAGLAQQLRERNFLPLTIRLNPEVDPLQAIYLGIENAAKQHRIEYTPGQKRTLWEYFKTAEFWSPHDILMTPVLILDQFEEFFTLHLPAQRKAFIAQFAGLVNGKTPKEVQASVSLGKELPYSDTPPNVKAILSMREDFLGYMEEMERAIPTILHTTFRLSPLHREQAKQAIIEPAQLQDDQIATSRFSYTPEAIDAILNFLCKRKEKGEMIATEEVEPFQLQVLCQHIERRILEQPEKQGVEIVVQKDDLGGETGMQEVLENFYDDQTKRIGSLWERRKVRHLCEKGLISPTDRRLTLEEEYIERRFHVPKFLLAKLVNSRLLRAEPQFGGMYYELSHDTLVQPIRNSQKKRKRRNIVLSAVLSFVIILLVSMLTVNYYRESQAKYRALEALNQQIEAKRQKLEKIKQLCEEAEQLRFKRKPNEAIQRYEDVIELDNSYVEAYVDLGEVYREQNEWDNTIQTYREAIEMGIDDDVRIYYQLGKALSERGGFKEPMEAIKNYEKALELDSNLAIAHIGLGNMYRAQSKFEEAENHYQEALWIDSGENADAYKELAILYIQQGEFEKAIEEYNRAIGISAEYANMYGELATALQAQVGDPKRYVEQLYESASTVVSKEASFYYDLGRAWVDLNKYDKAAENFQKAIECDPDNPDAYVFLGYSLLSQKKYEEAITQYQIAIEKGAKFYVYRGLGDALFNQKKYDEAIEYYQKALQFDERDIYAYYQLGEVFSEQSDYDKAIEQYQKVLEIDPKNAEAFQKIGFMFQNQNQYEQAIEQYQKAIELDPKFASAYNNWGNMLYTQGRYDEAIEKVHKALQVNLKDAYIGSYAYNKLGDILSNQGKYDGAIKHYRRVIQIDPKNAAAYQNIGFVFKAQGEYDKAIEQYWKALEVDPKFVSAYNNLGDALAVQQNYDDAIAQYQKALEIAPEDAYICSYAYNGLGNVFLNQGKYDEAIKHYRRVIQIDPKNAAAYQNIGFVFKAQGEYDKAIEQYWKALEVDPTFAYAYNNLGDALAVQQKYDDAIAQYHKALEIAPEDAYICSYAYNRLGTVLYTQEKNQEAIESYQKAIELEPNTVYFYNDLGNALANLGKYVEAINQYRKVIELDPNNANAYQNIGFVFKAQGKYDEAIEQYRKALEVDPKFVSAYNNLGDAFRIQGNYDEAIKQYHNALEITPAATYIHNYAYSGLGHVFNAQGKYDTAIEQYRKALELAPDLNFVHPYTGLGHAFRAQGKHDKAIGNYQKAIELDPKDSNAYIGLGETLLQQGKYDEAQKYFQQAIQIDPKYAAAYNGLGGAFAEQGKYEKAIEQYRKALALDPKNVYTYLGLGYYVFAEQGKYEEAIEQFNKAIEIAPESTHPYRTFGKFYSNYVYDYQRAYTLCEKAYSLAPEDGWVKANFVETNLVTERFEQAVVLAREVLERQNVRPEAILAMRHIIIAALLFQEQRPEAYAELKDFIEYYRSLSEYDEQGWRYQGTKNFIEKTAKLSPADKTLLLTLIEFLESPKTEGDKKIKELEFGLTNSFNEVEKPDITP